MAVIYRNIKERYKFISITVELNNCAVLDLYTQCLTSDELYLCFMTIDDFTDNMSIATRYKKTNNKEMAHVTIFYTNETHPEIVEFKLTWL